MYKVKLSVEPNDLLGRQLPGNGFMWGDYRFYINVEIEEADFWVVYSKGLKKDESCIVAPENTLFITGEPKTVYVYSKLFVKQFCNAFVCQDTGHPHQTYKQPALPWIVGRTLDNNAVATMNYDALKDSLPLKTKLISVISSNKAFTKGHQLRIDFVNKLKAYYGDKIDVYGRGIQSFDDKWDVIAPYKYHICIENSSFPHYWTEKLADSFLGLSYPIYYGCPDLDKYFDKRAFTTIDINDFEASKRIIDNILEENKYEKNLDALKEAKQLVLDKYNLFAEIAGFCDQQNAHAPKKKITLKSESSFPDISKVIKLGLSRVYYNVRNKIK